MKILVVTNMYPDAADPVRGIFVKEQIDALRALGLEVDLLVLPVQRTRLHYVWGMLRVLVQTMRIRYDVVHAHYGFTGVVCLARFRSKLVITFHGSDVNIAWQRRISAWAYRYSDSAVFVAKPLHALFHYEKGVVIPCGIDTSFFKPRETLAARKMTGLPMDKKLILFPSNRQNKIKNFELFSETIQLLERSDIHVVELSGWSRDQVPFVMAACDVLLMTSHHEGSPMVIKEALACNLPVVSVNVGDVAEVLVSIKGCYVGAHNAEELAPAVAQALDIKEFNGRSAREYFDGTIIAQRLKEIYNQVCAE